MAFIWIDKTTHKHTTYLRIGPRLKVYAKRWPWMRRDNLALLEYGSVKSGDKYGWKLLNKDTTLGRWGGGTQWSFGIHGGMSSITFDLLWGFVTFSWYKESV